MDKYPYIDYIQDVDKYNILSNNSDNFYTNSEAYRLGDGFYLTDDKSKWVSCELSDIDKNHISLEQIIEKYPNSILSEYIVRSNKQRKQWNILIDIVNNKFVPDPTIDKNTSCLMHIRLGDILELLCNKKCLYDKFYLNKDTFDKNSKIGWYKLKSRNIDNINYFIGKINNLKQLGINKIYIISGSHIKLDNYKYSQYYLNKIIEVFENENIKCYKIIGNNPDNDLLFSMNFNYFIPSSGGYTKLIKELNTKINPNFLLI